MLNAECSMLNAFPLFFRPLPATLAHHVSADVSGVGFRLRGGHGRPSAGPKPFPFPQPGAFAGATGIETAAGNSDPFIAARFVAERPGANHAYSGTARA
jgi:hypothetical protein